jgi:hypothetical protein
MLVNVHNTNCSHIVFEYNNENYEFTWNSPPDETTDSSIVYAIKCDIQETPSLNTAQQIRNWLDKRDY